MSLTRGLTTAAAPRTPPGNAGALWPGVFVCYVPHGPGIFLPA